MESQGPHLALDGRGHGGWTKPQEHRTSNFHPHPRCSNPRVVCPPAIDISYDTIYLGPRLIFDLLLMSVRFDRRSALASVGVTADVASFHHQWTFRYRQSSPRFGAESVRTTESGADEARAKHTAEIIPHPHINASYFRQAAWTTSHQVSDDFFFNIDGCASSLLSMLSDPD